MPPGSKSIILHYSTIKLSQYLFGNGTKSTTGVRWCVYTCDSVFGLALVRFCYSYLPYRRSPEGSHRKDSRLEQQVAYLQELLLLQDKDERGAVGGDLQELSMAFTPMKCGLASIPTGPLLVS